jgi:2-dehydro-3-deoxygluconokinase
MNGEFWTAGECMLEMRNGGEDAFAVSAAGDTYNTAVYFKRLMPSVPVRYVSALGADSVSRRLREHLRGHGIDDSLVATHPERLPGIYLIENDEKGERHFRYWRQHSAARDMLSDAHAAQVSEVLPACEALLISGITLAILDMQRRETLLGLAGEIRRRGGWVIVDNNYRPSLWPRDEASSWLQKALETCSHALLSFDDEVALHGDADPIATIRRLRGLNRDAEIVIKLGEEGCIVAHEGEECVRVPAVPVRAIDTTAAGDSFNAAYLAARWSGMPPLESARRGCQLAACVVAHPGAIVSREAMEIRLPSLSATQVELVK